MYIPRSGIPGSYGNFVFNILRHLQIAFQMDAPFYIPTSKERGGSNVFTCSPILLLVCPFYFSSHGGCEMVSQSVCFKKLMFIFQQPYFHFPFRSMWKNSLRSPSGYSYPFRDLGLRSSKLGEPEHSIHPEIPSWSQPFQRHPALPFQSL